MPTHVKIFRHRQDPQFSAAKEAVGRLKTRGVAREQDGMLVSILQKSKLKYDHESIIAGKTVINLSDVRQSKKQVDALRQVLRGRGWKLVAKNTYAKPE